MTATDRTGGHYAIIVEFDLNPGASESFMGHLAANAEASVRDEPGCYRFDVLTPRTGDDTNRVTLYEIYRDRAAFEEHLQSPHFRTFRNATGALVRRQTVLEFDVSQNTKAA